MGRGRRAWIGLAAAAIAVCATAPGASAAPPDPQPYRANDAGGFRNVMPPGSNGLANATQLISFLTTGNRPPHNNDQYAMYEDLVYAAPGLDASRIGEFFKDASFGVREGDVERNYTPQCSLPTAPQSDACEQVRIVRDRGFGVPHIYGSTRAGAIFGTGYAAAEGRLFLIDALRHAGRAQLSSFAGGAEANREMDHDVWANQPYTESELRMQFDRGDDLYGARGVQVQRDVVNFVDGINQYIAEARLNPLKMPGEYGAINRPQGPSDWKVTDVIATASLVAGIFGRGGGNEVGSALVLEQARERFGRKKGKKAWADFRSAEDPEAQTTVHKKKFAYGKTPRKVRGRALPDPGSTRVEEVAPGAGGGGGGLLPGLRALQGGSNALLVSARESESGRPLAVMGPQVSYFTPQLLMEQDVHAPKTSSGPAIDARGAAFPGVNLYVQLGRGRDFSWSATSAGQDITDTFAVPLCEPDGSQPSLDSQHYLYRGQCLSFEILERTNSWVPNLADQTPPGSETLRTLRTKLGLVTHRATIKGEPYAYTKLRVTYFHEADSAFGFSRFNDPDAIRGPQDFQRAAHDIQYTFNWFYADDEHIAYFNSGKNPVRARKVDPNFPTMGTPRFEWRGFQPVPTVAADQTPFRKHPQVIDQTFLTSWNNKQARAFRAADDNYGYQSLYRVKPLDDRIRRATKGKRKMSLAELIDAMEDAGTVDLRGDAVLKWALKVIEARKVKDGELRSAIATLQRWRRSGAHRRDRDGNGVYEDADAVRIMDAWWPRLLEAQFKPALGDGLFERIQTMIGLDDEPRAQGSAYQSGWYGYAEKDLRSVLGGGGARNAPRGRSPHVKGRYSREYCGGGKLRKCRARLIGSLKQALAVPPEELYGSDSCDGGDPQWCNDAVRFRALGAITQPPMHWINRPTFQQVVEIP
jgi:acyl-homoserine lactone acylase PvdQ